MEVRIQAIHFDATERLQDFIQKKAAKLEKYCDDINKRSEEHTSELQSPQ